jgi:folate-binding protein YgfZ
MRQRGNNASLIRAAAPESVMTDITLAATPTATPLTAWLESGDSHPQTATYRGAITPAQLDAPEAETAALAYGAAVHDLGWLRRVEVRGEDRFRWLSGMVTNTVNDLGPSHGNYSLVLNAQGRIQGDMTVWRNHASDDKLELEIASDQIDPLLAHFEHFIIMDDVELIPRERETALGLTGPLAGEVLARLGLPALAEARMHTRADFNGLSLRIRRGHGTLSQHYLLWTTTGTVGKLWKFLITGGATPIGSDSLEKFRITEGIPAYGIDIAERDLPQETSQVDRALHFSKGCYLGQEIVERIRSRGNVHKHLRQVELDGPVPPAGTELELDGGAVGHITSAAELPLPNGPRRFAMAMVRAEAEAVNKPLSYASDGTAGKARLLTAPPTL